MAYFETKVLDDQIKAMPTIDTASGSIATFTTDMTENIISCVAAIPDTGSSVVNVSVCGTNSFDNTVTPFRTGEYINGIFSDVLYYSSNANYNVYKIPVSGDIYISRIKANSPMWAICDNNDVVRDGKRYQECATGEEKTFVINNTVTGYILISVAVTGTFKCDDILSVYTGTTYTVNLGSTVLGGTIDVVTGKIIDGSDNVSFAQNTVEMPTLNGTNNVFADTGDIDTLKYILSVGEALS